MLSCLPMVHGGMAERAGSLIDTLYSLYALGGRTSKCADLVFADDVASSCMDLVFSDEPAADRFVFADVVPSRRADRLSECGAGLSSPVCCSRFSL